MKKVVCVCVMVAMVFTFTGCPLIGGSIAKDIIGTWQYIEEAAVLSLSTTENIGYANETVANNFSNDGRTCKTATFSESGKFTYLEESWLPDRESTLGSRYIEANGEYMDDGGAAVGWGWRQTQYVKGTYETGPYDGNTSLIFSIPGMDTELYVNVSKYTTTYTTKRDKTDDYNRNFYQYDEVDATSDASNPLGMYALLGMNSFEQLLIGWDGVGGIWKDFNENVMGIEVYLRQD